jgi:hypothetical protein
MVSRVVGLASGRELRAKAADIESVICDRKKESG